MNKFSTLFLLLLIGQTTHKSFAHVYVEGYLGGVASRSKISSLTTANTYDVQDLTAVFDVPTSKLPSAITGGLRIGWWPNHRARNNRSSWYEYVGFYADTRLSNLEYNHQICATNVCYSNCSAQAYGTTDIGFFNKGLAIIFAGLLAVRCGFLATEEIPFGRLQPYLALGPAGLFIRRKICLTISPHETDGDHLTVTLKNPYTILPQKRWSRAICCAFDAGMRYLASSHVFLDFSFNYRFSPTRIFMECTPQLCVKQRYHFYSFDTGVGYEF